MLRARGGGWIGWKKDEGVQKVRQQTEKGGKASLQTTKIPDGALSDRDFRVEKEVIESQKKANAGCRPDACPRQEATVAGVARGNKRRGVRAAFQFEARPRPSSFPAAAAAAVRTPHRREARRRHFRDW